MSVFFVHLLLPWARKAVTSWRVSPAGTLHTILEPALIFRTLGFHLQPFAQEPEMTLVRAGAAAGISITDPAASAITTDHAAGPRKRAKLIEPHPQTRLARSQSILSPIRLGAGARMWVGGIFTYFLPRVRPTAAGLEGEGEAIRINRDDEPAYAGGLTFQKVPLALGGEELAAADVAIVGAPVDDMVSNRPGARFGPREIRIATDGGGPPEAWHMDLGIDPFAELAIVDHGDASVMPGDARASHDAIAAAVERVLDAGAIPIVLGGDHSIAYPDIKAVAARHEPGALAVVQFDTHADTASELWGVRHSHGCPFRHLVDERIVAGDRLVQVGLHGYWPGPDEFGWMRGAGLRWHRMDEVFERGIVAVVDTVLQEIAGAKELFLSVDVDVLDPAFAPGTGTPEPGGMTTGDLLRAVRRLTIARGLAGMEVVELSPPYDHAGITAMAAHRTVLEALSGLALYRSGRSATPEEPQRTRAKATSSRTPSAER
jgi:agmatinase